VAKNPLPNRLVIKILRFLLSVAVRPFANHAQDEMVLLVKRNQIHISQSAIMILIMFNLINFIRIAL